MGVSIWARYPCTPDALHVLEAIALECEDCGGLLRQTPNPETPEPETPEPPKTCPSSTLLRLTDFSQVDFLDVRYKHINFVAKMTLSKLGSRHRPIER